MTTFTLQPAPPFRLDLTVWALRRRPDNAIDHWDGTTYRRALILDGASVEIAVHQSGPPEVPSLRAYVTGTARCSVRAGVVGALEHILGLSADLAGFYRMADTDPLLGPLAARWRGLHPPRLASLFEALVNAVSCQQLSLTVGVVLLNRLTRTYGRAAEGGTLRAFPEPDDLAAAAPAQLRQLGYSGRKSQVLIGLARQVADGTLGLDDLVGDDDATAVSRLCKLDGIGRWSAEYVLLRGLGRTNVFPGDDVGARNKLSRWLGVAQPLDYRAVGGVVDRWQPYAGLIYFHLLLDSLAASGWLSEEPAPVVENRR